MANAYGVLAAAAWRPLVRQPPARPVSLIVIGGTVITENASHQVLSPGAVAINGTDIVAVDRPEVIRRRVTAPRRPSTRAGEIVLPGLINTHTHAPMVMYRGLADDLALMDWLQKYIFPAEAKTVSPEFVRVGTRLAALEMIESGTTTYADMYYFEEEIAKATREAGLRGVLGETIIQFPVADAKTPAEGPGARRAVHQGVQGRQPDRAGRGAARALHERQGDARRLRAALARSYDVPLIIHLAETEDEVARSRRAAPDDADRLSRVDRLLGTENAGGARRLGDRRRHRDPEAARRRRLAQPGKQHEAGERRRAGHEVSRGRRGARPRHRRRGQQQRPRHVRGDAPGVVPGQARDARSDGRARRRRRSTWRRSAARGRSGWTG